MPLIIDNMKMNEDESDYDYQSTRNLLMARTFGANIPLGERRCVLARINSHRSPQNWRTWFARLIMRLTGRKCRQQTHSKNLRGF